MGINRAFKAGDLVAFSGDSPLSDLINVATYGVPRWGITHVGMVADDLLFESTTLDGLPCRILGKHIDGVQAHLLEDAIAAYHGRVWLYPLYRPLFEFEETRLSGFLRSKIGVGYDQLGAMRSAGVGLSYVESLFRPESLNTIFCSELVAKAYSEIGLFPTSNASRINPNRLVRHLRYHEILLSPRRLK